jgi:hypothetical protein
MIYASSAILTGFRLACSEQQGLGPSQIVQRVDVVDASCIGHWQFKRCAAAHHTERTTLTAEFQQRLTTVSRKANRVSALARVAW